MGIEIAYRRVEASSVDALPPLFWPTERADVAVCEILSEGVGISVGAPDREDGILLRLQLTDLRAHHCTVGGTLVDLDAMPAGSVVLHDMRDDPRILLDQPAHTVLFFIARSAFRRMIADSGRCWRDALRTETVSLDAVVYNLAICMLPELGRAGVGERSFVEHLVMALAAHIASEYVAVEAKAAPIRGGLAGWQVRKAQDLLAGDLTGRMELADVASECGLSVSHFSRSFRQTVGETPHSWLIRRRVESAKTMLRDDATSLADIALSCGFSDQSHFTRIFSREEGLSPGAWRRAYRPEPTLVAA